MRTYAYHTADGKVRSIVLFSGKSKMSLMKSASPGEVITELRDSGIKDLSAPEHFKQIFDLSIPTPTFSAKKRR